MRRLRLRELAVGLGLHGVDEVGELDRVLDEEDRDVVADDVPVALLRVELHGEATHVAGEVGRALAAGHRREAHEGGRALARALEEVGLGEVGQRLVGLEEAVRAVAAGVHDPLGDALVIEVEDLLAEVEVLEERRPPLAHPQGVLVVGDRNTLLGGQPAGPVDGYLVGLARVPGAVLRGSVRRLLRGRHGRAMPDRGRVQPWSGEALHELERGLRDVLPPGVDDE